jgi:hypothetical protein
VGTHRAFMTRSPSTSANPASAHRAIASIRIAVSSLRNVPLVCVLEGLFSGLRHHPVCDAGHCCAFDVPSPERSSDRCPMSFRDRFPFSTEEVTGGTGSVVRFTINI